MKNFYVICPTGVLFVILLILGCSEKPITYNIDQPELTLDTLKLTGITATVYQTPPEMGSLSNLYFGNESGYSNLFTLFELYPNASGSSTFLFSNLTDSTITSIDSTVFVVTLSSDFNTVPQLPFGLYYFPESADSSLFNEAQSNFTNIDTTKIYQQERLLSTATITEVAVDTESVEYQMRFYIDLNDQPTKDFLTDTANVDIQRTFLVCEEDYLDDILSFRSSETSSGPRLNVYYRQQVIDDTGAVTIDTLTRIFLTRQDVTILKPASITTSDTTSISIGYAMGLKSIINFNLDTLLTLHTNAIFRENSKLLLRYDSELDYSGFSVLGYPLADSVEFNSYDFFAKDSFAVYSNMKMTNVSTESLLEIPIQSFLQYVHFNQIPNFGIKLLSDPGNDPFRTIRFFLANAANSLDPVIKIEYVSP